MQEPVLSYRSQITTLSREASRHHLLDLDDFTRDELEMVFSTTDAMKDVLSRDVGRVPTLRGKSVVTLFYEASTRTRVSFELAAKALSADTISVASATSSVAKGESLVDTVRTIAAMGVDAIILRHPMSGAPYLAARHTQASVINAGDGAHAHPTQALLDLYTIKSRLGRLEGIKVVIVGDVLHSRVARSNLWGLNLAGARVVVSGPPTLLPRNWTSTASYDEGEASAQALPPVAIEPNLE
ncbi:MAG: pyrB, partial [Dehalococcoidia bacterium]|nr:pyrB [Dehalococcoidia bacterium]